MIMRYLLLLCHGICRLIISNANVNTGEHFYNDPTHQYCIIAHNKFPRNEKT